jgi:hypothetical protein
MMNKPIDQMDSLSDMARFPWTVHLGASLNIVFSIWLTQRVFRISHGNFLYFLPFAVTLIACNLAPVIARRRSERKPAKLRNLEEMSFIEDQHRFSSWVYAIASGNMLFWVVFAWWVFTINAGPKSLLAAEGFAFMVTFVPLWRKRLFPKIGVEISTSNRISVL